MKVTVQVISGGNRWRKKQVSTGEEERESGKGGMIKNDKEVEKEEKMRERYEAGEGKDR